MVITVTAGARLPRAQAAHGDDAGRWGMGGGGVLSQQDKSVGTHTGGILPGVLLQLHSSPVTPDSFLPPPQPVKINSSDRRTAG